MGRRSRTPGPRLVDRRPPPRTSGGGRVALWSRALLMPVRREVPPPRVASGARPRGQALAGGAPGASMLASRPGAGTRRVAAWSQALAAGLVPASASHAMSNSPRAYHAGRGGLDKRAAELKCSDAIGSGQVHAETHGEHAYSRVLGRARLPDTLAHRPDHVAQDKF